MKIPFVSFELYQKAFKESIPTTEATAFNVNVSCHTKSRSSTVIEPLIGKTIGIYTGRRSKRILIRPGMVGYKLGCFAYTKKLGKSIHNSERNRKKIAKIRRKITQKKIRKTTNQKVKKKSKKTKKK